MRFFTRRCPAGYRTPDEQQELAEMPTKEESSITQRDRYDALHTSVSNQVEIIDGQATDQANTGAV